MAYRFPASSSVSYNQVSVDTYSNGDMKDTTGSHSARTTSFPRESTTFVGRHRETAEIENLLADSTCRLLTLVGPGGIGKTRLALAVLVRVKDQYAAGAHFVPLQSIDTTQHLITTVLNVLGPSLHGQQNPLAQLLEYLGNREMLLILDNFEQLLPAAGIDVITAILNNAPKVTLLVTSREVLNLQEEWLFPVQGLSVPDTVDNDIEKFGAVELFVERAQRVRRDFSLTDERRYVVDICQLVEGMPLALELAASWLKTLSCAAIAAEIRRTIDFLSTSVRNVPDRHRSMHAVFEQSWKMLSREERSVFKRLSIFRGGCQRAAAESVAGATLSILSTLVDKCMLRREDQRFHIHELLRQYGEEQLEESSSEATRVHRLHCEYYTNFLHSRLEAMNGFEQHQAAIEIAAELENIRAAWQFAVQTDDVDAIGRAATTYFFFCQARSYFLEGANALADAADSLKEQPASTQRDHTLARLHNHEGWLRIRIGEFDTARTVLERSRALYGRLDTPPPPHMGGDPATPLAIVSIIQGDHDWAVALCESALQAADARGDKQNLSFAHYALTAAKLAQGDYDAAYQHAERACALARDAGNHWFLAYPLNEWGNVARAMGDYDEAKQHYQASYALKEKFRDAEGMAVALNHLGDIAVRQSEYVEARRLFQQGRDLYRDINDRGGLATSLKGLGQVAYARGEAADARDYFQDALRIAADIQFLPLVCSIILEIEELLDPDLSVAALTVVHRHPASDHETKTRAQQRLDRYEADIDADDFARAVRQGTDWKLDAAVTALQAALAAPAEDGEGQPAQEQPLVEPLTDREIEVLRLLAKGRTNPEIAETLVIALGTVKWYASQIYGKLGVTNRTEAAARARELGLV